MRLHNSRVCNTWLSAQQNHPGRRQLPGPIRRLLAWSYILFLVCVRVLRHASGGQRTSYWSQFSPSLCVGPRDGTQFARLGSKWLYHGAISLALMGRFLIQLGNGGRGRTKDTLSGKKNLKNQIASTKKGPASYLTPNMSSLASGFQWKPLGPGN